MMFDIAITAVLVLVLYSQHVTRKRMQVLQSSLTELGPVIDAFSEAVDKTEGSIASMQESAEEIASRISRESSDAERRVRLMTNVKGSKPRIAFGGMPGLNSRKPQMINDFWNKQ